METFRTGINIDSLKNPCVAELSASTDKSSDTIIPRFYFRNTVKLLLWNNIGDQWELLFIIFSQSVIIYFKNSMQLQQTNQIHQSVIPSS